jgi:DNA-binding transcriptional regulator YdaS (Cro superfamily)
MSVWATEQGLSISSVSRYLNHIGTLSVQNALAIEEACDEEVTLRDLLYRYKQYS